MDQQIHISIIKEEPQESTSESIKHIKIERENINETPSVMGCTPLKSELLDHNCTMTSGNMFDTSLVVCKEELNDSSMGILPLHGKCNDSLVSSERFNQFVEKKQDKGLPVYRILKHEELSESKIMSNNLGQITKHVKEEHSDVHLYIPLVYTTSSGHLSKISKITDYNERNITSEINNSSSEDESKKYIKANDEFKEIEEDLVSDKYQTLLRRFYNKSNTESNSKVIDLTTTEEDVTKHENLTNGVTDRAKVEANACKDLLKAKTSDDVGSEMKTESHLEQRTVKVKDNMYACSRCKFVTKYRHNLSVHFKKHTGEKPFSCAFCDYKCGQKGQLVNHVRIHTGEKPFSCDLCDYKCARKYRLDAHMTTHSHEKPFSCNVCSYRSGLKQNLISHIRTHTGEKPYSCPLCNYKCGWRQHLVGHMRIHTGDKPFSCSSCSYRCSLKQSLIKHIRTHTGEKPFTCDICQLKFGQRNTWKKHMTIHADHRTFSCQFCSYKCSLKESLEKHKARCSEKPFSCDYCGYKCAIKQNLVSHIRTHTGDKPYSCSICHLKCGQKGDLERHLRTHTGEKPFSCEFCDYKCGRRYSLGKHMLTHTGEKPFPCSICNYRSSYKHSLVNHMRTHTGEEYYCKLCGHRSPRKYDFERHMRNHEQIKGSMDQLFKILK